MPADPLQQLLAGVRSLASACNPGRAPVRVRIDFDHGPPLTLPVSPLTPPPPLAGKGPAPAPAPTPPDAGGEAEAPERPPKSLRVTIDILAVLGEVKRPLTCTRLLAEMAQRGIEWSERTVADALARLAEDGTLTNPCDRKRPGYCLPEHDDRL